jgi:hypothetical protein
MALLAGDGIAAVQTDLRDPDAALGLEVPIIHPCWSELWTRFSARTAPKRGPAL